MEINSKNFKKLLFYWGIYHSKFCIYYRNVNLKKNIANIYWKEC